ESAMGLSVAGEWEAAEKAYGFLRDTQRGDGSWPLKWQDGVAESTDTDANFCAYVAVGVWHHHLVTARAGFLESMWPTRSEEHTSELQSRFDLVWRLLLETKNSTCTVF